MLSQGQRFAAILATTVMLSTGAHLRAQEVATAPLIAARVQAFYGAMPAVRLRFTQHYWSHALGRNARSTRGALAIARPDLFRFDYDSGLVLASDGADRVVHFEPGEAGEAGQYWRGRTDAVGRIASLLSGGDLTAHYRISVPTRLYGDAAPEDTDVLELTPRSTDPSVRRIWLFVSHRDALSGLVQRVSIEDPEGNWNHFHFAAFEFEPIPAASFAFTPPADAREID